MTTIENSQTINTTVDGSLIVERNGKLKLHGLVRGTVVVLDGGAAEIDGTVGGLQVQPGGQAILRGTCKGNAENSGGELSIFGVVSGRLVGAEDPGTHIDRNAVIGR